MPSLVGALVVTPTATGGLVRVIPGTSVGNLVGAPCVSGRPGAPRRGVGPARPLSKDSKKEGRKSSLACKNKRRHKHPKSGASTVYGGWVAQNLESSVTPGVDANACPDASRRPSPSGAVRGGNTRPVSRAEEVRATATGRGVWCGGVTGRMVSRCDNDAPTKTHR